MLASGLPAHTHTEIHGADMPTVLDPVVAAPAVTHLLDETRAPLRRLLAVGLVLIALGLAAVALVGPLASDLIHYRVSETYRNQTIGLDAVSLFVVAPLSLLAAGMVWRGHLSGPVLALAVGAYTPYMFLQYIVGPDYAHLPGDNERLFPLYVLLFAAGWLVALGAWTMLGGERLGGSRRRDRAIGRVILPALALVTFSRYLPSVTDALSNTPGPAYRAGRSFFWAIAVLDLGVLLPAVVLTCAGLVRGAAWARKALCAVVGWLGLVGCAVAAMAVAMTVNDDPTATTGGTVLMIVLGLAYAALAVAVFGPLFRRRAQTGFEDGA